MTEPRRVEMNRPRSPGARQQEVGDRLSHAGLPETASRDELISRGGGGSNQCASVAGHHKLIQAVLIRPEWRRQIRNVPVPIECLF
jgi:hypothetical protein